MKGKLIVIEGVDSSGKETQTKRLVEKLEKENIPVKMISFPDYESDSSALVKMYLGGEFGGTPEAVGAYAASLFYAVDRYASYNRSWKKDLESGITIVCDRYVTSNMIHQAAKIESESEKEEFLTWLCDLEYKKLDLPEPDVVFFLDMPPEMSAKLMEERRNKITGGEQKDIHETNREYLKKSYKNAKFIADKFGFTLIECVQNDCLRSIENIGEEILETVNALWEEV